MHHARRAARLASPRGALRGWKATGGRARAFARPFVLVLLAALLIGMPAATPADALGGPGPAQSVRAGTAIDKFGAGQVVGFSPPEAQPTMGALAREAGLRWTGEGFPWHLMEPSPGTYSFVNQDRWVNSATASGLRILGNIGHTPRFYSSRPQSNNYLMYPPTSSEALAAWSRFVTAVVNRYKDRIQHWLIWPNLDDRTYWMPEDPGYRGGQEYKEVLRVAYQAIKAADPSATVVTASMDPPVLNEVLDAGGLPYFDAVGVHNYANVAVPNTAIPEASALLTLRLAAVQDVMQRRTGDKPLWVTEYAWPNAPVPMGVSEDTQAAYLVRSMLLQEAHPNVARIFWQSFQDVPLGPTYDPNRLEDNYGMALKANGTKKLGFDAFKAMTTALAGATFSAQRTVPTGPVQLLDDFETRPYTPYYAGGATVAYYRVPAPRSGAYSGQVIYNLPGGGGSTSIVPNSPAAPLPVAGAPTRVKVWAKGDGGPAPQLSLGFEDAHGQTFTVVMGLISGTDWREYTQFLDYPLGTSAVIGGSDRPIAYPIRFTGFIVSNWSIATQATAGSLLIDDLTFESGPSVLDLSYRTGSSTVHALWSLGPYTTVSIPTTSTSATVRDWRNGVAGVPVTNGQVSVSVGPYPIFLTLSDLPPPDCGANPRVTVTTVRAGLNALRVTVTANGANNRVKELQFARLTNAAIEAENQLSASAPFNVTVAGMPAQTSFLVRRTGGVGAGLAELSVLDRCAAWKTFVGGGPNAWGG